VDHAVQLEAFWVVEKLELQLAHTRLVVLLPAICTYVPAAQFDHVVQLDPFWEVL
jgi:hypothetical protein